MMKLLPKIINEIIMKTHINKVCFGLLVAVLPFATQAQNNEKDRQYNREHPSVITAEPAKQGAKDIEKDKQYAKQHPADYTKHTEPASVKEQSLRKDEMYSKGEWKNTTAPTGSATEAKRQGPVPVVKPSGKEANHTKVVEHPKHTGPTPVVRPSGKEARNYKPVVHKKHTGPTPVIKPSGKEAERNVRQNH